MKATHKNAYNEIIRRRIYAYDSPLKPITPNALFTMRNGNKLRVYLNFNNFKQPARKHFDYAHNYRAHVYARLKILAVRFSTLGNL